MFARVLGITHQQTYAKYEAGKAMPAADVAQRIASTIGVSLAALLGDSSPNAQSAIRATLAEAPAQYTFGAPLPAGQWPARLAAYLDARRDIIDGMVRGGAGFKAAVLGLILSWIEEEKKVKS